MTKEELLRIISAFPDRAEVLINIGERYAEIRDVELEYSIRTTERKPYVIINIFNEGRK